MPHYEPYHVVYDRAESNQEFREWLSTLKEEFHNEFPGDYLAIDGTNCLAAFENNLAPKQVLFDKKYSNL